MATSTEERYHDNGTETSETTTSTEVSSTSSTCPSSNFPDKFQDFFAALTEDTDDLPSMLEDKLIPRFAKFIFKYIQKNDFFNLKKLVF